MTRYEELNLELRHIEVQVQKISAALDVKFSNARYLELNRLVRLHDYILDEMTKYT